MLFALTALPLCPCYVDGVLSTILSRLCYDHGTFMPRWRRSHLALNRFCRCLPRPCKFVRLCDVLGFEYNTTIVFSEIRFFFNNYTVNMNSVQNSEILLPLCLLQCLMNSLLFLWLEEGDEYGLEEDTNLAGCVLWFSEDRRLQFGHYDRLLEKLRKEYQQPFFNFPRMP